MTNQTFADNMLTEEEFLLHSTTADGMTEDEYLEHFGKKGMKWGVRKEGPKLTADGREVKTRKELRTLDKASRVADRTKAREEFIKKNAKNDAAIDAARKRVKSGAGADAYMTARAQYKSDRKVIGKREAAKAFNKVKTKNFNDYQKSKELKSGKETNIALVKEIGKIALNEYLRGK